MVLLRDLSLQFVPVQGSVLDVPPGSALESALGAAITDLTGEALNNAQTGSGTTPGADSN